MTSSSAQVQQVEPDASSARDVGLSRYEDWELDDPGRESRKCDRSGTRSGAVWSGWWRNWCRMAARVPVDACTLPTAHSRCGRRSVTAYSATTRPSSRLHRGVPC